MVWVNSESPLKHLKSLDEVGDQDMYVFVFVQKLHPNFTFLIFIFR